VKAKQKELYNLQRILRYILLGLISLNAFLLHGSDASEMLSLNQFIAEKPQYRIVRYSDKEHVAAIYEFLNNKISNTDKTYFQVTANWSIWSSLIKSDKPTHLVFKGEKVVGVMIYRINDGRTIEIKYFATLPQNRIGKALLCHLAHIEKEYPHWSLYTYQDNTPAQEAFERLGFIQTKTAIGNTGKRLIQYGYDLTTDSSHFRLCSDFEKRLKDNSWEKIHVISKNNNEVCIVFPTQTVALSYTHHLYSPFCTAAATALIGAYYIRKGRLRPIQACIGLSLLPITHCTLYRYNQSQISKVGITMPKLFFQHYLSTLTIAQGQ